MTKRLMPLGDRVLVKEIKNKENKTLGGIIIPETVHSLDVKLATVIAVGEGLYTQNGIKIPMSTRVGDQVMIPFGTGQEVKVDGEEYLLFRESELLMILADIEYDA